MMVSLLVLVSIVYMTNCETINCDGDCSCPTAPTPGETCVLNCEKADSCKSKQLGCRAGDPCIVQCIGDASCADSTTIDASTSTDVSIICNGVDACKVGIDITCGTAHCDLQCLTVTGCEKFGSVNVAQSSSFECINCPNAAITNLQFTANPTTNPTQLPTVDSLYPTTTPTYNPSKYPTIHPTIYPSINPTYRPTYNPTIAPTNVPIKTISPTLTPTITPTNNPTLIPSIPPTLTPSITPSKNPTNIPSISPTINPTNIPTILPTISPTVNPIANPTNIPTILPTSNPSVSPTYNPSVSPTSNPSVSPTSNPSVSPTLTPSYNPTSNPTIKPSISAVATFNPTHIHNANPINNPPSNQVEIGSIVTAEIIVTINTDESIINILVELQHIFIVSEDINNIKNILEQITNEFIKKDCGYSPGFDSVYFPENVKEATTIINASIITCDASTNSTLIENIQNLNFEQELITNIRQKTLIQIVFNQPVIIQHKKSKKSKQSTITTQSTTTTVQTYSYISWMLKLILFQLGVCCFLIVCYFGLKIRTKKLKVNKLAIQKQINQEKSKQINDVIIQSIIVSPRVDGNDIITANQNINENVNHSEETMAFSDVVSDESFDESFDEKNLKTTPKYTNYYIRQLMNKMIANANKNSNNTSNKKISRNKKADAVSEIEVPTLSKTRYPNHGQIDGDPGYKTMFHRIDTDTTFPSIPKHLSYNDNTAPIPESLASDVDMNCIHVQPQMQQQTITNIQISLSRQSMSMSMPMYHKRHNHRSGYTPSSSIHADKFRKSSYLTICEKCGTSHANDDANQQTNCAVFSKFNY